MGKLSEHYMQEQQDEFELELSYQEWLIDNLQEPTAEELDEMEHDLTKKPYFVQNLIVTDQPLNNTNYNPMEGLS